MPGNNRITEQIMSRDQENQRTSKVTSISNVIESNGGNLTDEIVRALNDKLSDLTRDLINKTNKSYSSEVASSFGKAFEETLKDIQKNDATVKNAERIAATKAWEESIKAATNPEQKAKLEKDFARQQRKWSQEEHDAKMAEIAESTKEYKENVIGAAKGLFTGSGSLKERFKELGDALKGDGNKDGLAGALKEGLDALASFSSALKSTINTIGQYKTNWDTRLHGSVLQNHTTLTALVKNAVGVSPFVKQSQVMENLNSAVNQGISYNVAERAYLETLSDSIATTFEAFSATMDNLIRVQQADSTAQRLGMEAQMNEYLNAMFQNTEYLTDEFDSVTNSLYQATSLLSANQSIDFEYQAQKWLGALYSVGMSGESINSIASALGALASGDVSATDSGAGKLLVMAAANAGLDYAKMLSDGLDGSEMNTLMRAMVDYLQTIADDNNVVQNRLANVFGLRTSDIRAAGNLSGMSSDIYRTNAGYSASDATSELMKMMGTIGLRTNFASMLSNIRDNFQYTLAAGIADNPILYTTYVIADLLKEATGTGISIPFISAAGFGVDLETNVADLMKIGVLGSSLLGGIGSMISGLGQLGAGVLPSYGLFEATSYATNSLGRGLSSSLYESRNTSSEASTTYIGNSSGDDVITSTEASAQDNKVQAASTVDTEDNKEIADLYDINTQILDVLTELANGDKSISVRFDNPLSSSLSALDLETH